MTPRRRDRAIVVTTLLLLLALLSGCLRTPPHHTTDLPPILPIPNNLDFESPHTTPANYWWDPWGGPYSTEFAEVNPPIHWTATWFESFRCPGTAIWQTGRPEVGLITAAVDPSRVRNGEQALRVFTFHRCHIAAVHQRFSVIPGQAYRLTAYAHTWYSNCSSKPHYTGCALDWNCRTCVNTKHGFRVGLDPAGAINPSDASVVWSPPREIYGQYDQPLVVVATATSDSMTAHLLGIAPLPLRHNDDYWDHITIEPVQVYHLPIILKMVTHSATRLATDVTTTEVQ